MNKKSISIIIICALIVLYMPGMAQDNYPRFVSEQPPIDILAVINADANYNFSSHLSSRVASQSYIDLNPDKNIGLDTDTMSKQVMGAQLIALGLAPLGVSTDGSAALLTDGEFLFTKLADDIKMLAFNIEKSGDSIDAEDYYNHSPINKLMGVEGVVFSKDGRYMLMPNCMDELQFMPKRPLMLIDAEKGEIYSIRSYDDTPMLTNYYQAIFSPDSAYVYYTEMVEKSLRLCRYNIEKGTNETVLDTGERLTGWPGMEIDENGIIRCYIGDGIKTNYLATFVPENSKYSFNKEELPSTIDLNILTGKP